MRSFFLCLLILSFVCCKQKFDTRTYIENKASLAQKEQSHPQEFLKIFADDKKNLFGATIVKGKVVNNASICGYKNTRLKMLCFKNNIRVEEHEDILSDVIQPGDSKNFKTKYHLPKGTDSVALSVISADPVLMDTLK